MEAAAKGGESWPGFAQEVNAEDHVAKLSALDDLASDAFIRFEQTCIDENADRARVQLTSIERYEHRHMLKLTEILQRMSDRGEGRLKAATQGRMAKLKERCELQRRTIKQKAETTAECQQLCFGVIRIN